ncbi:MAG: hypothetical protein HY093_00710 [Candidatus Liptonbacteria bacterium]|nr:hypothetical protein [Candidatus Liptonbacteria bacterium]
MIGSEIMRAKTWQKKNPKYFREAIERAFPLVDFSLSDPKWQEDRYVLTILREELEKFHTGVRSDSIETLYQNL